MQALNELEARDVDEETLDAIDRGEAQIQCGEVHEWEDGREQVRSKFLGT